MIDYSALAEVMYLVAGVATHWLDDISCLEVGRGGIKYTTTDQEHYTMLYLIKGSGSLWLYITE